MQQHPSGRMPPPPPGGAAAPGAGPAPGPSQELTQTATIRNAVNLKKNTLEAVPIPGTPNKLAITFTFDASQPCAVTTFVAATEEPARACRLTPAKQEAAPPLFYEKGVRRRGRCHRPAACCNAVPAWICPRPCTSLQHVPSRALSPSNRPLTSVPLPPCVLLASSPLQLGLKFPGSAPEGAQHVIDMGLYDEAALFAAGRDTFPLVVRLETVTDKGRREGRTLQELR